MPNVQMDQYLATVAARLKSLSAAERDEELREIRQHLEALVAGHMAQGRSEDAAVTLAIQQFGRAEQIGAELKKVRDDDRNHHIRAFLFSYVTVTAFMFLFFASMTDDPAGYPYGLAETFTAAFTSTLPAFSIPIAGYLSRKYKQRKRA